MSWVVRTVRFPWRIDLSASSSTCATRYSTSRARFSVTSWLRLLMPTDSATSRMLSGFQTDMLGSHDFDCSSKRKRGVSEPLRTVRRVARAPTSLDRIYGGLESGSHAGTASGFRKLDG